MQSHNFIESDLRVCFSVEYEYVRVHHLLLSSPIHPFSLNKRLGRPLQEGVPRRSPSQEPRHRQIPQHDSSRHRGWLSRDQCSVTRCPHVHPTCDDSTGNVRFLEGKTVRICSGCCQHVGRRRCFYHWVYVSRCRGQSNPPTECGFLY
jgi:hypothetical protein